MSSRNIQMKNGNGQSWDNLYPVTLDANVYSSNGISVKDNLKSLDNKYTNVTDGINSNINNMKQRENEIERIAKIANYSDLDNFLNRQQFIGKMQTRFYGEKMFPQGFSFNQDNGELYVVRHENGAETANITIYSFPDMAIKQRKNYSKSSGSYQEGLPYFYNDNGDLCFIVRTKYDLKAAIFNYTTGKRSSEFNLNGGSRMGCDPERKYLITNIGDANRLEGCYIYDFHSVSSQNPILLRKIFFDMEVVNGEKPQGMTIVNDKIIISRGASNSKCVITSINFNGITTNSFNLDTSSLGEAIKKYDPSSSFNPNDYEYENEGVSFYKSGDFYYPVIAHVVSGGNGTTYFAIIGQPQFDEIETSLSNRYISDEVQWNTLPLNSEFEPYGDDVVPMFAKDKSGFVHLKGSIRHSYFGEKPNKTIATLPFPYLPTYNQNFFTVGSGDSVSGGPLFGNIIMVRATGDIILWKTNVANHEDNQFTHLDGIIYYCGGREWH